MRRFRKSIISTMLVAMIFSSGMQLNLVKDEKGTDRFTNEKRQFVAPKPGVFEDGMKDPHRDKALDGNYNFEELLNKRSPIKTYSSGGPSYIESLTQGKTHKVLVIPVLFSDSDPLDIKDKEYYVSRVDELREYYEFNSSYDGSTKGITLDLEVVDTVTLSKPMSYYGGDDADYIDINIRDLPKDATTALDERGFDFSTFDTDADSLVDHIIIIHASDGQETTGISNQIWSHKWTSRKETFDGVKIYNYVTVPYDAKLGVTAHEFGHSLGLVDLYDVDGAANGQTRGIGKWGIMAWGSYNGKEKGDNPANLSAWSKEFLGWGDTTDISKDSTITINNKNGYSDIYRVGTNGGDTSLEYYLIEYRRHIGYDSDLPGEGVLIYHIDNEGLEDVGFRYTNNIANRQFVELEQADGDSDILFNYNYGDIHDPFGNDEHNFAFYPNKFNESNAYAYEVATIGSSLLDQYNDVDILDITLNEDVATVSVYVETATKLETPDVTAPEDNLLIAAGYPTFKWDLVPLATEYTFQISTKSDFSSEVVEYDLTDSGTTLVYDGMSLSYTLPSTPALLDKTVYYWRLSGKNANISDNNITWSEVKTFALDFTVDLVFDGNDANKIMGFTDQMEFSYDGGETYETSSTPDVEIDRSKLDADNDILVRYINSSFWSTTTPKTIDIEEDLTEPDDFSVTGTEYEFSVDSGDTWLSASEPNLDTVTDGQTIWLRKVFISKTMYPNYIEETYYETIPKGNITYTIGGDDDRKLMGSTVYMEYSTDAGASYTICSGNDVEIPSIGTDGILVRFVDTPYWDLGTGSIVDLYEYKTISGGDVTFSLSGENANKLMGSTTAMEFSLDGGINYTTVESDDYEINPEDLSAADDVKIRYEEANGNIPENVYSFDILDGPAAPSITDSDSTIEFSLDNGSTWTLIDGTNIPSLNHDDTIVIRVAAVDLTLKGEELADTCKKDIADGYITYSFDGDYANKLMNSSDLMEYSLDDGGSYTRISTDDKDKIINKDDIDYTNGVIIRYSKTPYWTNGVSQTIDFTQGPDDVLRDPVLDNTMEYSTDSGTTWNQFTSKKIDIADDLSIEIRKKAVGTTFEGVATTNTFNRSLNETVTFSFDGADANKLMGSTDSMEYSIDGGSTYISITTADEVISDASIELMTETNDILIRYKETNIFIAGDDIALDLQAAPEKPTTVTSDSSYNISGMDATMEYSISGGPWTTYVDQTVALLAGQNIKVRVLGTGMTLPGEIKTISRPSASSSSSSSGASNGGSSSGSSSAYVPPYVEPEEDEDPMADVKKDADVVIDKFVINSKKEFLTIDISDEKEDEKAVIALNMNVFKSSKYRDQTINIVGKDISFYLGQDILGDSYTDIAEDAYFKMGILRTDEKYIDNRLKIDIDEKSKDYKRPNQNIFELSAEVKTKNKTKFVSGFDDKLTAFINLENFDLEEIDVDKLGVYYFNETKKEWEYVGGIYNKKSNTLEFEINHFSFYSVMEFDVRFDDMTNHWAKDDVSDMASKHIAYGRTSEIFDPNSTITRAEFTALIVRVMNQFSTKDIQFGDTSVVPYDDVPTGKWYQDEILGAYKYGLVSLDVMKYRPDVEITREEMAAMVAKALSKEIDLSGSQVKNILSLYIDSDEIADENKESIAVAIKEGIINGRTINTIVPGGNATRAEAIVMIKRLVSSYVN